MLAYGCGGSTVTVRVMKVVLLGVTVGLVLLCTSVYYVLRLLRWATPRCVIR